ncbi:hypothetical protein [Arthrobacter globiformis]|uniref:hypothetical protein n=1 Tax=Arthrobacter globiformis TaxID=1665 RepID=UPI002790D7D3|nr:hypothetical protein [Arthrobacter globiformis]MDQ0620093.1 hypothetical protein [Arthrobacter globiformis]
MRIIWTITILTAVAVGFLLCYLIQAFVGAAAHPDSSLLVKDWLTASLSIAAVLIASGALFFNWLKAKQENFLNIHDKLVDVEVQEGRRLLHNEIENEDDPARLMREDATKYDKINRALALYDVLGLYVSKRYVFKDWVLDEWGPALVRARPHARHFIAHRDKQGGGPSWPNFAALSLAAVVRQQKRPAFQKGREPRICEKCGASHY